MQIAGSTCTVCDQKIVLSRDGKSCPKCEYFVHLTCEPKPSCKICGQPFETYKKPKFDLQNDAIVPRSLRINSPGPAFAVFILIFLAVFVVVMVIYLMTLA